NGNVFIHGAVTESVSANNGLAGFVLSAPSGFGLPSHLSIIRSVAYSNGTLGAQSDGISAFVLLGENFMMANKSGTDFKFTNSENIGSNRKNRAGGVPNFPQQKQ